MRRSSVAGCSRHSRLTPHTHARRTHPCSTATACYIPPIVVVGSVKSQGNPTDLEVMEMTLDDLPLRRKKHAMWMLRELHRRGYAFPRMACVRHWEPPWMHGAVDDLPDCGLASCIRVSDRNGHIDALYIPDREASARALLGQVSCAEASPLYQLEPSSL